MDQVLLINQKILYIGANSSEKNLNMEINNESEAIQRLMDANDSKFWVDLRLIGMVTQVSEAIQRKTSPQIIHISGHATEEGKIDIIDKQDPNKGEHLEPDTLVEFLKNAGNVNCVLLNFCYSRKAADLIAKEAQNVGCVIGINGDIDSTAAVDFSKAFYKSLQGKILNNQSVIVEAFSKGRAAASQITKKDAYILFSGTFKKVVSISCLGDVPGYRFLDGRTREGTVGLAPSTTGLFTGTRWEINELSSSGNTTVITLECLGDVPGYRFLDGRTREGTVGLAPSTTGVFTGTRWEMNELSSSGNTTVVTLKCLGDVEGPRFLNGKIADEIVELVHSTEGLSSTKWEIMLIS
ncbi:hypothetical protein [Calothrix sp. 336/3]|uniref:hypothetical protein n=1 Tax=Calothrix sp. 336/3 TaxID=1337936 RepID=UPI0004E430DA|nr:hypothetical protein [Calothrix sp. 336/3]AKG23225.1 hypothetical protein IJ00_19840 [Calothrix sp. 336/3]